MIDSKRTVSFAQNSNQLGHYLMVPVVGITVPDQRLSISRVSSYFYESKQCHQFSSSQQTYQYCLV